MKLVKLDEDVELWVVSGDGWTLPVYLNHATLDGMSVAILRLADHSRADSWDLLNSRLEQYCFNDKNGRWVVPMSAVHSVATKAPGITPSRYVSFNDKGEQTTKEETIEQKEDRPFKKTTSDMEGFLQYIANKAPGEIDVSNLRVVWALICGSLHEWLIHERKPVNLGWISIFAVPYRANWKQILLRKFEGLSRVYKMTKAERDELLSRSGLWRELNNTDLIELDEATETFGWSIEVVKSQAFEEKIKSREAKFVQKYGKTTYCHRWLSMVQSMEKTIYEILSNFVLKTTIPCAMPSASNGNRSMALVACIPRGRVRPVSGDLSQAAAVYAPAPEATRLQGEPKPLEIEAPVVHEMPILRLPSADMRDAGRDDGLGGNAPAIEA